MTQSTPILLIQSQQSEWDQATALPHPSDNIFQRLIRNPHIDSPKPRERECTEMVCAVLRNTSELRLRIFRWLAQVSGTGVPDFEELTFSIETERSIGSKRDDLRIEGWRTTDDDQELAFLWTIEVKVGATFHESSAIDLFDADAEEQDTEDLVNQLVNYDSWLSQQSAEQRAGFVLAIENKAADVPLNLSCKWKCFTWADLGRCVRDALDKNALPAVDRLLAKHLLGFIRTHLWSESDMSSDRIEFDDIALLRAMHLIGNRCSNKCNRLVKQLSQVLEDSGVGDGKIISNPTNLTNYGRMTIKRKLFNSKLATHPYMQLGVEGDSLAILLETPPT